MTQTEQDNKNGETSARGALSHIRVLDLSRVLAGPWAAQMLGDMGADVIKVERPGHGDDTRLWGPPFIENADGSAGDASYFTTANRNKRSIVIDFSDPRGAELVRKLAARADVIVENFIAGGLKKYGLDYHALAKLNQSLVYCSITGFGQDGPYAQRPGYDYIIQGMGGVMSVTGRPDGTPGEGPLKVGVAISDLFGGMYAATAILSALVHRERTGEGQFLDCSLLDAQAVALANQAASYLISGIAPQRMGNSHPALAPYRTYDTADGAVTLAAANDAQFARLCTALGLDDIANNAKFASNAARLKNRAALDALIEDALAKRKRDEVIATLAKATVPCGPIYGIDELFNDPQIEHRALVHKPVRADGTQVPVTGYPVKMSATPASCRRAPPAHGVDTDEVLREELGLAAEEMDALRKDGVIGG